MTNAELRATRAATRDRVLAVLHSNRPRFERIGTEYADDDIITVVLNNIASEIARDLVPMVPDVEAASARLADA